MEFFAIFLISAAFSLILLTGWFLRPINITQGKYKISLIRKGKKYYLSNDNTENRDRYYDLTHFVDKEELADYWQFEKSEDDKYYAIKDVESGKYLTFNRNYKGITLDELSDYVYDESSWFSIEGYHDGLYIKSLATQDYLYIKDNASLRLTSNFSRLNPFCLEKEEEPKQETSTIGDDEVRTINFNHSFEIKTRTNPEQKDSATCFFVNKIGDKIRIKISPPENTEFINFYWSINDQKPKHPHQSKDGSYYLTYTNRNSTNKTVLIKTFGTLINCENKNLTIPLNSDE